MTEFDNIIKHMVQQRATLRSTIKKSLVDLLNREFDKLPHLINHFHIATNPIDFDVEYFISSNDVNLTELNGSLKYGVYNRDEMDANEEEFYERLQSIKFDELLAGIGLCAINLNESITVEWKSDDRI